MKAIDDTVIESLDIETANILIQCLTIIVNEMIKKQNEGVDVQHIHQHLPKFVDYILKCHAAFITFKVQRKEDPQNIKDNKSAADALMTSLT